MSLFDLSLFDFEERLDGEVLRSFFITLLGIPESDLLSLFSDCLSEVVVFLSFDFLRSEDFFRSSERFLSAERLSLDLLSFLDLPVRPRSSTFIRSERSSRRSSVFADFLSSRARESVLVSFLLSSLR